MPNYILFENGLDRILLEDASGAMLNEDSPGLKILSGTAQGDGTSTGYLAGGSSQILIHILSGTAVGSGNSTGYLVDQGSTRGIVHILSGTPMGIGNSTGYLLSNLDYDLNGGMFFSII